MKWFYYLLYIAIFCNMCGIAQDKTPYIMDGVRKVYCYGTLQDEYYLFDVIKSDRYVYTFWSKRKLNPKYAVTLNFNKQFYSIIEEVESEGNLSLDESLGRINEILINNKIPAKAVGRKIEE